MFPRPILGAVPLEMAPALVEHGTVQCMLDSVTQQLVQVDDRLAEVCAEAKTVAGMREQEVLLLSEQEELLSRISNLQEFAKLHSEEDSLDLLSAGDETELEMMEVEAREEELRRELQALSEQLADAADVDLEAQHLQKQRDELDRKRTYLQEQLAVAKSIPAASPVNTPPTLCVDDAAPTDTQSALPSGVDVSTTVATTAVAIRPRVATVQMRMHMPFELVFRELNLAELRETPEVFDRFQEEYVAAVATALGVGPEAVRVTGVEAGSVRMQTLVTVAASDEEEEEGDEEGGAAGRIASRLQDAWSSESSASELLSGSDLGGMAVAIRHPPGPWVQSSSTGAGLDRAQALIGTMSALREQLTSAQAELTRCRAELHEKAAYVQQLEERAQDARLERAGLEADLEAVKAHGEGGVDEQQQQHLAGDTPHDLAELLEEVEAYRNRADEAEATSRSLAMRLEEVERLNSRMEEEGRRSLSEQARSLQDPQDVQGGAAQERALVRPEGIGEEASVETLRAQVVQLRAEAKEWEEDAVIARAGRQLLEQELSNLRDEMEEMEEELARAKQAGDRNVAPLKDVAGVSEELVDPRAVEQLTQERAQLLFELDQVKNQLVQLQARQGVVAEHAQSARTPERPAAAEGAYPAALEEAERRLAELGQAAATLTPSADAHDLSALSGLELQTMLDATVLHRAGLEEEAEALQRDGGANQQEMERLQVAVATVQGESSMIVEGARRQEPDQELGHQFEDELEHRQTLASARLRELQGELATVLRLEEARQQQVAAVGDLLNQARAEEAKVRAALEQHAINDPVEAQGAAEGGSLEIATDASAAPSPSSSEPDAPAAASPCASPVAAIQMEGFVTYTNEFYDGGQRGGGGEVRPASRSPALTGARTHEGIDPAFADDSSDDLDFVHVASVDADQQAASGDEDREGGRADDEAPGVGRRLIELLLARADAGGFHSEALERLSAMNGAADRMEPREYLEATAVVLGHMEAQLETARAEAAALTLRNAHLAQALQEPRGPVDNREASSPSSRPDPSPAGRREGSPSEKLLASDCADSVSIGASSPNTPRLDTPGSAGASGGTPADLSRFTSFTNATFDGSDGASPSDSAAFGAGPAERAQNQHRLEDMDQVVVSDLPPEMNISLDCDGEAVVDTQSVVKELRSALSEASRERDELLAQNKRLEQLLSGGAAEEAACEGATPRSLGAAFSGVAGEEDDSWLMTAGDDSGDEDRAPSLPSPSRCAPGVEGQFPSADAAAAGASEVEGEDRLLMTPQEQLSEATARRDELQAEMDEAEEQGHQCLRYLEQVEDAMRCLANEAAGMEEQLEAMAEMELAGAAGDVCQDEAAAQLESELEEQIQRGEALASERDRLSEQLQIAREDQAARAGEMSELQSLIGVLEVELGVASGTPEAGAPSPSQSPSPCSPLRPSPDPSPNVDAGSVDELSAALTAAQEEAASTQAELQEQVEEVRHWKRELMAAQELNRELEAKLAQGVAADDAACEELKQSLQAAQFQAWERTEQIAQQVRVCSTGCVGFEEWLLEFRGFAGGSVGMAARGKESCIKLHVSFPTHRRPMGLDFCTQQIF